MGKWLIFLIALGVASNNGVEVQTWVWVLTAVLTAIGSVGQLIKLAEENK